MPHADLWVEAPFGDDASVSLSVLGRNACGITLPGGARTVVIATSLVHDSKRIALLSRAYTAQLRDVAPDAAARPKVASLVRNVHVDLTRFEFEG
ncbi:MAG: hypothetical protein U0168_24530 [Nannocystaceae bacterium]